MKLRANLPLALAFATISLSAAPTVSAKTDSFTEALQNYYVASQELQGQLLHSSFILEKTLTQEPQVDALKKMGESFPDVVREYRDSFEKLQEYSSNATVKKQHSAVLEKIADDDNEKALPVLAQYSEALETFSESMKSQTFTVYGQEGWANSGIQVTQGDLIWVNSEGAWQASPNYSPVTSEGYICRSESYALNKNAPLGALLYRVRGSSNINGSGLDQNSRGKADASGRLEFIMNDEDRRNNAGQQRLSVVVMNQDDLKQLIRTFQELRDLAKD